MSSHVDEEIASQPDCWQRAVDSAAEFAAVLPQRGDRVAVIGCGTSAHIAASFASARESSGAGVTDWFAASEAFVDRGYDLVLAITRSGTTTEVLDALGRVPAGVRTVAVTADASTPIATAAQQLVLLDYADEQSVVQTRFATTTLVLLLTHIGIDVSGAIAQARGVLATAPDATLIDRPHYAFLGSGWTIGLATEAALKVREAASAWSESYSGKEYRHGPLSAAFDRSVIWIIGEPAENLVRDVSVSGATIVDDRLEPLADLVRAQRIAVETSRARGLDPDHPRHLTRSVVLT